MAGKWIVVSAIAAAAIVGAEEPVTLSREMDMKSTYQAILTRLKRDGLV
jgi:hypothetical protein